jgi:hypothetical protein
MREIELKIALDSADGDRLVGHLLSPEGEPRPFDGWLGLISALDAELSPTSEAEAAHVNESRRQREDSGGGSDA